MRISVIIPVFNAAAYVEQAVASALAQPETGEVLLVEDGSPDGSLAECEKLAAANAAVRLLRHPNGENRGAGAARNLGIEQAACPLVAFLDADDYYLPGRFTEAAALLSARPDVDGVYDFVDIVAEGAEARQRWEESGWPLRLGVNREVAPEQLFEALVGGGVGAFHTDGIVVRRDLFGRTGLFDPRFRTAQDTHLWIRMAAVGRLVPGPAGHVVGCCRIHAGNRVLGQPRREQVAGVRQVWADLIRWGRQQALPPHRIQRMARRYVSASRGMLLGQPGLAAWGTALGTLGVLARHCPRPWQVGGFRNLAGEASGIGLAIQRGMDRIHRRRRAGGEVGGAGPRIAMVNVWFGPLPFWMPAFLLSCRHNPTIDWLVFTDAEPPADVPANVKFIPLDLASFNQRATQALGFNVQVMPVFTYKVCDLKVMQGRIFEPELRGYDYWACCDMDVVWGDIRRFLTPERLAAYEVITPRPGRVAGHFTCFRNRPEWNDLFRRIPRVAELVADSAKFHRLDEDGLTHVLKQSRQNLVARWWGRHVKGRPVPRVYWERLWAPNGRHQRLMLRNPALAMRWKKGRTFNVHGEEMMYLHFHKIRDKMREIDFSLRDAPGEFTVTPTGFNAVRGKEPEGGVH
jgi:hypothetical protein